MLIMLLGKLEEGFYLRVDLLLLLLSEGDCSVVLVEASLVVVKFPQLLLELKLVVKVFAGASLKNLY